MGTVRGSPHPWRFLQPSMLFAASGSFIYIGIFAKTLII
jgi:hypothetical protein